MKTKLILKICLLFLTGLAINRLPSDILADPPLAEAAAKSKVQGSLPEQGGVFMDLRHLYHTKQRPRLQKFRQTGLRKLLKSR